MSDKPNILRLGPRNNALRRSLSRVWRSRDVGCDPTVSGATLLMPWGERIYIDAEEARATSEPPR